MKARLLLTSALFALVQIPALRAQVTVDVSKITCDQLLMEKPVPAKYVVLWLSGYYNGKRNNTIIEPEAMDKNEEKVDFYCNLHRETTVMDAVKDVLGLDK
ncbi:MAG: HdeA/HdeB family chaperone [Xanthobacteraceae bacterium]